MLAKAWLSPPIRLSSFDGTTMAMASVAGHDQQQHDRRGEQDRPRVVPARPGDVAGMGRRLLGAGEDEEGAAGEDERLHVAEVGDQLAGLER